MRNAGMPTSPSCTERGAMWQPQTALGSGFFLQHLRAALCLTFFARAGDTGAFQGCCDELISFTFLEGSEALKALNFCTSFGIPFQLSLNE